MAQGWHTDAIQENTGWKWPNFNITANCKIIIANCLTNHCIANMIFHEQLNISIYKSTNYFKNYSARTKSTLHTETTESFLARTKCETDLFIIVKLLCLS